MNRLILYIVLASFLIVPTCFASTDETNLLTGTKTIGGTTPDFATFAAATTALVNQGVGTGGVTFLVRPGNYYEWITINTVFGTSAGNPVLFQNSGGTVTLMPQVNGGVHGGILLVGCSYITFDGINVTDTTTGNNFLTYGYWVINANATQGAQYNTFKNATITLRKDFNSYGVYQNYNAQPTSMQGSNSFNRYLNLKISKARNGVYLNAFTSFSDVGVEVGSDSSGLNYPKRFIIGALANDTIGGSGGCIGITATNMNALSIHDVDIRNMYAIGNGTFMDGISYTNPTGGPNVICNCRIYNLYGIATTQWVFIRGIWFGNANAQQVNVYNNMLYNFQTVCPGGPANQAGYPLVGFYCNGAETIDGNTFLLDQGTATNSLNSCSYDILVNGPTGDTLRNNVIANLTAAQTGASYHYGMYVNHSVTSFYSNNNVFYTPNANGCVGSFNLVNQVTLTAWQSTALSPDANSYYGDPRFVSATYPYDVHIRPNQLTSLEESHGVPISYVTTDIDGQRRNATTPDIGADEGNFLYPIALTRPVGGELFRTGTVDTIRWTCAGLTGNIKISLMRNFPTGSWDSLTTTSVNSNYYLWNVTGPATTNASIRIMTLTAPIVFDSSSATFTIATPSLALQRPAGGEVLYIGTNDTVRWTSNYLGTVTIKLNRTYPTGAWTTLATGISISQGYYGFAVTPLASTTARFAVISDALPSLADTSRTNVTLHNRALQVTHPNGGETLLIGLADTIRWNNLGTYPILVGISYASNVFDSMQTLTTTLPVNSTSFIWTPTGRTGTHCRIYLVDGGGIETWSSNDFTIAVPTLAIQRPNGNETFVIGSTDTIRWTSQYLTGNVRIQINRNYPNGSWDSVATVDVSATPYQWLVSGPSSFTARMRVVSASIPALSSTGNANFNLVNPTLTFTQPYNGDTLRIDSTVTLRWNSRYVTGNVRIQLNRNPPTGNWDSIATVAVGSSPYNWTASGTESNNCYLRISAFSMPTVGDTLHILVLRHNSNVNEKLTGIPNEYTLAAAYPNPFNNSVNFTIGVPKNSKIAVKVYNIEGQLVGTVFSGELTSGYHSVSWNAREAASGTYIVSMEAAGFTQRKMIQYLR